MTNGPQTPPRGSYLRNRDVVACGQSNQWQVALQDRPDTPRPQRSLPPSLPADDKLEQQHSLFTRYKDPCRLGPGEEKPWAIGELGLGLGLGWGRGCRVSGDERPGAGERHC